MNKDDNFYGMTFYSAFNSATFLQVDRANRGSKTAYLPHIVMSQIALSSVSGNGHTSNS